MPVPYDFLGENLSLGRYVSHYYVPYSLNQTYRWGSHWLDCSHPYQSRCPKLRFSWAVLHPNNDTQLLP